MSSDSTKELIHSYIQSEGVDATARYVGRGRAYKELPDRELQGTWVRAFKEWSPDDGQADLLEDLASELSLRGLGIDRGLPPQDLLAMVTKVAQLGPFSEEAETELSQQLAAYVKTRSDQAN